MEIQVGMKLTVRGDLKEADSKDNNLFKSGVVSEMYQYRLEQVTVAKVFDDECCYIEEDGNTYFWDKNMFKEFL